MKFKTLALATGCALSIVVGTSAVAAPIVGTASLSGFFDTYSASANAIVNDLNAIDVQAAALVGGTTTDFQPNGVATATDFTIVPLVPGMIYTFNGFTFQVTSIAGITRGGLTCNQTGCIDSLGFGIGGTVSKAGFDNTLFSGVWTGNGSCSQAVGGAGGSPCWSICTPERHCLNVAGNAPAEWQAISRRHSSSATTYFVSIGCCRACSQRLAAPPRTARTSEKITLPVRT